MASKIAWENMEPLRGAAHTCVMGKKKASPHPKPQRRPTFIRQWRKYRDGMTQESLIDRLDALGVSLSAGQLSRIESGKQEYRQDQLEAIAVVLRCEVADLLMRDPTDPDGLWSIYEGLSAVERRQVVEIAKTLKRTGTSG